MIKNAFAYVTRKSLKSLIIILVILSMSTLSLISLSTKTTRVYQSAFLFSTCNSHDIIIFTRRTHSVGESL